MRFELRCGLRERLWRFLYGKKLYYLGRSSSDITINLFAIKDRVQLKYPDTTRGEGFNYLIKQAVETIIHEHVHYTLDDIKCDYLNQEFIIDKMGLNRTRDYLMGKNKNDKKRIR